MNESERRIARMLRVLAEGPVEGQAEANGWTPEMVAYGNKVLLAAAKAVEAGFHNWNVIADAVKEHGDERQ